MGFSFTKFITSLSMADLILMKTKSPSPDALPLMSGLGLYRIGQSEPPPAPSSLNYWHSLVCTRRHRGAAQKRFSAPGYKFLSICVVVNSGAPNGGALDDHHSRSSSQSMICPKIFPHRRPEKGSRGEEND